MTENKSSSCGGGAEEMEPAKAPKAPAPKAGLKSDDLTDVLETNGHLTFGGTGGTSVDVTVDIPVNSPAMEEMSLYGSSTDSTPSDNATNLIAYGATRPSSGRLVCNGASCTAGSTYYVQLKFWYHDQPVKRADNATILSGNRSTSGNITLS